MAVQLSRHPVHLGLGASATSEPEMDGMAWYDAYIERHASDGTEGRLVSLHHFEADWDNWEMHPAGDEVVVCIAGTITLIQEREGVQRETVLEAGDYAINPRGVWHTANVASAASALFITAGFGTLGRPR